jgi:AhpD family alkylhydroperoxidase
MSNSMSRMRISETAPAPYAAMYRLEASIELDKPLRELIKLRASQINGCAFCIDMHYQDARAAGETEQRLYTLDAWRETDLYTERERAALELCEAVTRITSGHVPDHVWDRARAAFDERELGQVLFAISAINTWNRLMIATRTPAGEYKPARRQAA